MRGRPRRRLGHAHRPPRGHVLPRKKPLRRRQIWGSLQTRWLSARRDEGHHLWEWVHSGFPNRGTGSNWNLHDQILDGLWPQHRGPTSSHTHHRAASCSHLRLNEGSQVTSGDSHFLQMPLPVLGILLLASVSDRPVADTSCSRIPLTYFTWLLCHKSLEGKARLKRTDL